MYGAEPLLHSAGNATQRGELKSAKKDGLAEKRLRARFLRDQGWRYHEIAEAFGVSKATAYRWVNVAFEERQRQISRDWKKRNQTECPGCGRLVYYQRSGRFCRDCEYESSEYRARRDRIGEAWRRGKTVSQIAATEGVSPKYVNSAISSWRVRGDDLPLHSLPHRDHDQRWRLIRKRIREGRTYREIAEEIGSTTGSVSHMVTQMRRKGMAVPRRYWDPQAQKIRFRDST